MKTFICRTSQAEDVAKHLSSYYPHEFTADGTKVFCEENLKDDEWLNEIKEHARGYFQGIVDTLASSDLAALRAERDELRDELKWAWDNLAKSEPYPDEECEYDRCTVCRCPDWKHSETCQLKEREAVARAVLAKYQAAK